MGEHGFIIKCKKCRLSTSLEAALDLYKETQILVRYDKLHDSAYLSLTCKCGNDFYKEEK